MNAPGSAILPPRLVDILNLPAKEQNLRVSGWLRTRRDAPSFSFLELNDGSCLQGLQIIAEHNLPGWESLHKQITTGAALAVRGRLMPSPARGQRVELRADEITVLGTADASYPLQKKRHSFEFLRSITHLRSRTNALGAVARVRNTLSSAIHQFLQAQGFIQVHTPLITTSDCEGAGEMFTVTTLSGTADYSRDFFGRHAGLTVSGQLQAEVYAMSHSRVYTFGPTFRAENSNTTRHLAEFWMLEPEVAFCDLEGDMRLAEALLRFVVGELLQKNAEDLALFDQRLEPGLLDKLRRFTTAPFQRLTYTEAIERLQASPHPFAAPVSWGMDLQAEHERYLAEKLVGGPLFVTNYPASLKPFYMRLDEGEQTVAAMDLLVPGIGELAGGSQREERLEVLEARMRTAGMDPAQYGWYLDLRRFGSAPHSGFGLGFERLVLFCTGSANIRECIPFPRTPGSAPC